MVGKLKRLLARKAEIERVSLGINERNLRLVYPLNDRKHYKLADDKVLTKSVLETHRIPTPRKLLVVEKVGEIAEKWQTMEPCSCAIKPAQGFGGGGILVLDHSVQSGWTQGGKRVPEEEIQRHLANIVFGVFSFGSGDKVLIEEKINQHPAVTNLCPTGVADVRLIVKHGEVLLSMLRVPTSASGGKANLHQGAAGVGIDIGSGVLGEVFDLKGFRTDHPDTGVAITGKPLPDWDRVRDICDQVNAAFPLDYLGVDIAFDAHLGPLVLEINVRPGLEIQNVNKTGLRTLIE